MMVASDIGPEHRARLLSRGPERKYACSGLPAKVNEPELDTGQKTGPRRWRMVRETRRGRVSAWETEQAIRRPPPSILAAMPLSRNGDFGGEPGPWRKSDA